MSLTSFVFFQALEPWSLIFIVARNILLLYDLIFKRAVFFYFSFYNISHPPLPKVTQGLV